MMRLTAIITFGFALAAHAAPTDPAAALATAKAYVASNRHAEAIPILEDALEPAGKIADPAARSQALAAIHFYAAVAYSARDQEEEALAHLEETLRLAPNIRSIDPTRYDARFVALFNRLRSGTEALESFETLYPGFSAVRTEIIESDAWQTPALEILGTTGEKRQWNAITAQSERAQFIAAFWRARDESPETAVNEYREAFSRRVAFADAIFGSPGRPGALTDRGRVFALLGTPSMVRRRALSSRDAMTVMNVGSRGIENGTIEYWFYTREQLPKTFGKPKITFRFVSHQGIGDYVLQKDGLVLNALAMASRPAGGE